MVGFNNVQIFDAQQVSSVSFFKKVNSRAFALNAVSPQKQMSKFTTEHNSIQKLTLFQNNSTKNLNENPDLSRFVLPALTDLQKTVNEKVQEKVQAK